MQEQQSREKLSQAKRIVVKIGSRVLIQRTGRPEQRRLRTLVKDLAYLHKQGCELVVVSSGAIGAGMEALGLKKRPTNLPDLQMAAAVGQSRLMARYDALFAEERCKIGQVLLTHDDLNNRTRHLNSRNTMMNLLRHGIIPIVNENDVVSVDEIKVGDNDFMAALVALLIQADALVLLTTTDGLRESTASGRTRRVPYLKGVTRQAMALVRGKTESLSTGGMSTKLQAAQMAVKSGIPAVIANGCKSGMLRDIFQKKSVGTLIASPTAKLELSERKKWIAFFHRASGSLLIDQGAAQAIEEKGTSLLAIGITQVEGRFEVGAVVNVKGPDGLLLARGLVEYTSDEIKTIQGHRASEIAGLIGHKDYDEVIHRDNMTVLNG